MKALYKLFAFITLGTALVLGSVSCSQVEYQHPDEAGIPIASEYEDCVTVEVDQETNYANFSFSAAGVYPVWIIDGVYSTSFELSKYYRKKGEYSIEVKVANANGMSDGSIIRTFEIENTKMSGFGGFVYDSDFNLWKTATLADPTFWYAPGWSQIADPEYTKTETGYTVSLPSATTEQWQAQMAIVTNISTVATSNYDFSMIFTSNKNHPGVTVKLESSADQNVFFFTEKISLEADEPVCFWMSDLQGIDIASVKLTLDFGGNAEGTEITFEDIVFKDHANDDGTVVPDVPDTPDEPEPDWVDIESDENLWNSAGEITITQYYADANWAAYPNPEVTVDGRSYSFTCPNATAAQWQNQFTLVTESLTTTSAVSYDLKVSITSSTDIANATVKLTQDDNDDVFVFVDNVSLLAGEETVFKAINRAGVDISKAKLVFDFGGNPANTTITIKDILLQEHKN